MSERIEAFWRDATAADVVRVMKGETVEARFRDAGENDWAEYHKELRGCKRFADGTMRWFSRDAHWAFCQVYDSPQWFRDKPEPGEGYRLLNKFPDEDLQPGDEVFDLRGDRKWEPSWNVETKHPQDPSGWYRRRVEQPKPEPKHYTLQVGDTCDVPSGHRITALADGIEVQ